ncbi:MAG TPA: ABC transporter permease [Gemmatimonadales bacterium]|nr:ABC transporter permease [Gemmatimonadales bacterium]
MRDTLRRDLAYALRGLRRSPAFTLIVVLTLGAGLGAATTIFSVVNGVLLRPLPYREPERLVMIWNDFGQGAQSLPATSATDYLDYDRETTLFEGFAAGTGGSEVGATGVLTGEGASERVELTPISANLLPLLGVKPVLGRSFTSEEEAPQGPKVVILTHGLWTRRYGGDRGIIGRTIQVDAVPHTVVGVLPAEFRLFLPAEAYAIRQGDIYTPLQIDRANLPPRNLTTLTVFGRVKRGVTLAQAQDEMNRVAARFRATYPEHKMSQVRIRAVPLQHDVVKDVEPTLVLLLAAVGLLVLIACANVANLLLARATGRERELAIRQAMGANRGQIVRQLLTESLLLAGMAGVIGVALTFTALAGLARLAPAGLPRLDDVRVDWRVAAFTIVLCVVTAVLFGLTPAVHAAEPSGGDVLRAGGRVANAGRQGRIRNVLIAAEIALSLVLLVGGGLLMRSFLALQQVRPGFEPTGVLTFQLSLPLGAYPEGAKRKQFYEELERRLTALPGVRSAARTNQLPLTGSGALQPYAYDEETARNFESVTAEARWVSPDYFKTLGTQVLSGRAFTPDDKAFGPSRTIIVDDRLAKRVWGRESPIGKQLQLEPTGTPNLNATVVGVVEATRMLGLDGYGLPAIYSPYPPFLTASYALRTAGEPAALIPAVRREVAAMDPSLPLADLKPMQDYVEDALAGPKLSLLLMQAVGGLALLLATIGIYGVISYSVNQRQREFGVRVALGETPGRLTRAVVLQGARLVGVSLVVGLAGAVLATRLLSGLLYGVSPGDPATFTGVTIALATVALAACYVPARRAARADPLSILRND